MVKEDPEQLLLEWEQCASPRQIALLRARWKGKLAVCFVSVLRDALAAYLLSTNDAKEEATQTPSTNLQNLHRLVLLHWNWVRKDPILGDELGRQGSHAILAKWMKHCTDCLEIDDEDDNLPARETMILDVQDKAYEIAALCRNFPMPTMPFTTEELQARLPLVFHTAASAAAPAGVSSSASHHCGTTTTLIQQVTSRQSAQDDVGFVMWPSAVVLSHWLTMSAAPTDGVEDTASTFSLRGKTVLEIGAGCGLAGLVAAQLQQNDPLLSSPKYELPGPTPSQKEASVQIAAAAEPKVILTDFNPTVLENLRLNVALNGVDCEVVGLDFYQQTSSNDAGWVDMNGRCRSHVDLVLGADIICQPSDAVAAAATVHCALKAGGVAYIVCADAEHRFGVDQFATECERVGLEVESRNAASDANPALELLREEGLEKTAGYVENMNMTIFTLRKRI